MAERRIIFPDDHPTYPGKSLIIPEDATQEQVDEVLKSFTSPPPTSGGMLSGVKNFAKGIIEGYGTLGALGDPETGVGIGGTMGGAIGEKETPFKPESPYPAPAEDDTFGRYAREAGRNVPGMVMTPGGPIPKLLYGPVAGLLGEGASDLTKNYVPGGEALAPYAKLAGAIFGPGVVRGAVTPNTIDPRRLVNNKVIDEELGKFGQTAGQAAGDKAAMSAELKARPSINEDQADALHQRVTAPTGSPTTNITPEWMSRTGRGIGNTYDNLERSTRIIPGGNRYLPSGSTFAVPELSNIEMRRPQDTKGILDIFHGVDDSLVPHKTAINGEKLHSALFNQHGTADLSGENYRRIRSNLYSAAEGANNETAHTYRQVAKALDNAMARTNPDWGQAWNTNNRRFANFKMAQNAANANKGEDQFTSKQWLSAGHKTMGPEDFANSESGRFLDAHAKVMPELKNFDPKPSPLVQLLGVPLGAAASVGLNKLGVPWHIAEPMLGGFLGLEAAKPISKMLAGKKILPQMNPLLQTYRKNQALPAVTDRARLMRALLNAPQNKTPESE